MRVETTALLLAAALGAACGARAAPDTAGRIASAVSAAPAAIGKDATVMLMDAKGMTVLRKGTNGWTCFPDDPATPGKDPMCLDANGMAWMEALTGHKPPPKGKVGMSYMLQGGSDASNLDPYLTKPPAGAKWVTTGPHIMILSAEAATSSGYPTRQAAPDTSRPYVMYGGTPYQHIMLPVN